MMAILLDPKGQSITVRIKSLNKESLDIVGVNEQQKQLNQDFKNEVLPINFDNDYGPHIKQLQGFNQWVNGLKVFEDQNLIVAWKKDNQAEDSNKQGKITAYKDQVIFYSLKNQLMYQQGEVWSRFYDPLIKEDFITDIIVYKKQNFFITAHHLGDIHLRKLTEIKNIEVESSDPKTPSIQAQNNNVKSVHVFKGHSKAVTSLAPIESKQSQFVSASTDGKVRIWCFEKMIELYCFDIQIDSPVQNSASADIISNVRLINQELYAIIFKKGLIEIGMISHLVSSNFITKQSILGVKKCFKNEEDKTENLIDNLVINFDDNSVIVYNPFEKYIKSTIYPPPTPAEVKQAFFCMCIQRMFLFLKDGSICIYNVQDETGILEKLSDPKSLKDYEGKQLSQQITSMQCCYTEPPKIDCEIFSDLFMYNEPANYDYEIIKDQSNGQADQFLVYGLSKGSVIFVKVNDLDHIYARFSIHREAIEQIHELVDRKVFLSICKEKVLQIWGFENNKLENYQYFDLYREVITIIVSNNDQMLLCFKKGDSELLIWNHQHKKLSTPINMFINQNIGDKKNEEIVKLKMDKSDEHENEITCFDALTKKGLYVTGDSEGIIKIWNCQKQLVRDIRFVDPINSVCFLNENADILIGHSGNLSTLNSVDYNDKKTEITQDQFYRLSQNTKPVDQKLFQNLKKETEKHIKKENDLQSQSTCSILSDKNSALSMKNKQNDNINEFELHVHRVTLNENERNKNVQKNHAADEHHNEGIQLGYQNLKKINQKQTQKWDTPSLQLNNRNNKNAIKNSSCIQSLKSSSQIANIIEIQSQQQVEVEDQISKKSSDSDLTPLQKEEKDMNVIIDLRKECSKVKSVLYNIQGIEKPINKRRKQTNQNFTRRIMTQNRIINNIQQRNNPEIPIKFNDFLVSCKTSSDFDVYSSIYKKSVINSHYGNGKSVAFNQTTQQSSHLSQKHTNKFASNDKSQSQNTAAIQENSKLSNKNEMQSFYKKVQKQSNMQLALQKMANSSNTFLITENNNFEPNRVKNHKLYKNIEKNSQIQELNSLLKNDQKQLQTYDFNQYRNLYTDTSFKGINRNKEQNLMDKQNSQPQQFINFKNDKMQSEQYLIAKNRNEDNDKQFQKSTLKQGYDQSPSTKQNSSPQNKFLNSTLMKTQSTMGRNQGEANAQVSESPTRMMFIGDQISKGETELKREIIKNNENLKQLAAIVDHKIGFKFSNQNTMPLNIESMSKNQENSIEKFQLNLTQNNNFQKSSAHINTNNHELQSQHDQPTIYHPSINKLENVSILSQNFNKEQKISVTQDKEDDYSQNISPMRLQRAENSSSHTQPLFISNKNENIQIQNNLQQQSENHNSRMQVIQKVNNKNNDKKVSENNIQISKNLVQQEIYDEYKINMNINKSPNKKIQSNSITNADGRDVSELATPSPVSNAQKLQNINSQILLVQKKCTEPDQKEIEIKKIEIQENSKGKNLLSDVNMFNSRILGTQRFQNSKQFVCTRLQMRANQLQSYRPHLVTNTTLNQIIKTAVEGDKLPQSQVTGKQQLPNLQNDNKTFSSPVNHPIQSSTIYTHNQYSSNNPTFEIAERTVITQNNRRTKYYKNQISKDEELSVDKLRNFQNTEINHNNFQKKLINKVDSDVNSSQQPSTNFKWDNTQNILQNNWPIITQNKINIEKFDSQNSSNQPANPISQQQNNIFQSQNSNQRIHNSLDSRAINIYSQVRPYDHPIFVKSLLSQDIQNPQSVIINNQNIGRKPQTAGNGGQRQFKQMKSVNQNKQKEDSDQIMQQQMMFGLQRGLMQSAQNDTKFNKRKMSSYQSNMKNLQIIQKFAVIQQKQHEFQKQFIDYNPYNLSNHQ